MENKQRVGFGRFVIDKVEELGGKSIKVDFTYEDQPRPVVILTGANGCGKTALLEVIHDMCKTDGTAVLYPTNIPVDDEDKIITAAFKQYVDKIIYTEDIKASVVYDRLNTDLGEVYKVIGTRFLTIDTIDKRDSEHYDKDQTVRALFSTVNGTREFQTLSSGLKKYLINIVYMMLIDFRDGIILLDNPDSGQHIVVQKEMIALYEKYAVEKNCQIFIATHSPFIVQDSWDSVYDVKLDNQYRVVIEPYIKPQH